jgi:hypothetical protein
MPHISLIFTRVTPKFETQIDILRWCFQWNQERCSKCHSVITAANTILTNWLHGRFHSVSATMSFTFDFTGQNYIKNWVISFLYIICKFWGYHNIEYECFGILECDDLCCCIYIEETAQVLRWMHHKSSNYWYTYLPYCTVLHPGSPYSKYIIIMLGARRIRLACYLARVGKTRHGHRHWYPNAHIQGSEDGLWLTEAIWQNAHWRNWQTISHTTQETQAEFGRSSWLIWISSMCLSRGSSNHPESSDCLTDGENVHVENKKKRPTCLIWKIQSVNLALKFCPVLFPLISKDLTK